MEIRVLTEHLAAGTRRAGAAVDASPALAILKYLLLQAEGDSLSLMGSDNNLWVQTRIPAEVKQPGMAAVPARLFQDLVSRFPKGHLTLRLEDDLVVEAPCGTYRMSCAYAEDYPQPPVLTDPKPFRVGLGVLRSLLGFVAHAVSHDPAKLFLSGVHLYPREGYLYAGATDGHRAALGKVALDGDAPDVLLPWRMAQAFLALDAPDTLITLSADPAQIQIEVGQTLLVGRQLSGPFPDFHRLMCEKKAEARVLVERRELQETLRRLMTIARLLNKRIRIRLDDGLLLVAEAPEVGRAQELIPATLSGSFPDPEIVLNAQYLLDALAACTSEKIQLLLEDKLKPILVQDSDNLALIMPIHSSKSV